MRPLRQASSSRPMALAASSRQERATATFVVGIPEGGVLLGSVISVLIASQGQTMQDHVARKMVGVGRRKDIVEKYVS